MTPFFRERGVDREVVKMNYEDFIDFGIHNAMIMILKNEMRKVNSCILFMPTDYRS